MNAAFLRPFYKSVWNIRGFVSSPLPWPCLYGENLPRVEGSPILPKLPWASQCFVHFLNYKARRIVPTQVSLCDGRVSSLAEPIFLHTNLLDLPAGVSLVRVEIIKAHAIAVGSGKGIFYLTWTLANFDSAGRVTLLPLTGLFHINEASDKDTPPVASSLALT